MKILLIFLFFLIAGYLSAQPPTSSFVATSPSCIGEPVVLTYTGNGASGDTYNWLIPPQATPSTLTGQGPHIIIFNTTGIFQVGLSVTGTGGTSDTTYVGVLITMLKSNCCTVPFPDAGFDQTVCGFSAIMSANQPVPGNITVWSLENGPVGGLALFSDSISPTTEVNVNLQGTYVFRWTEADGLCDSSDFVTIAFYSIPTALALVDPADTINCGRICDFLVAQEPTYGIGYWYDAVSGTEIFPGSDSDNPDSAVVTSYGMHYFYWVTVNGDCRDTSDVVAVNFYQQPEADAGGNYWPGLFGSNSHIKTDTTSGLTYILNAIPSIGTGMWVTLNSTNIYGFSLSPINPDTIYFYNYTSANHETLIRLEDNHSCVDKDTLFLWVLPGSNIEDKNHSMQVFVQPNPVKDNLFIHSEETPSIVSVYSITGELLLQRNNTRYVPIEELPDGIYMLGVRIKQGMTRTKFVKQH